MKMGIFTIVFLTGMLANANEVRYFLSFDGLSDPGNTDSSSVLPTNTQDPSADQGGTHRLYIWAQLLTPNSDLKGIDLAFRTTGDFQVDFVNIWQNQFDIPNVMRWEPGGVPGFSSADPSPAVAVLQPGVTNGAFAPFDDQWEASIGAAVIGFVQVTGTLGEVHIIHQESGFLQSGPHRVYLGLDDVIGAPADIPGQPYDNASPEAIIIPEPANVALLIACIPLLRLRRRV